MKHRPSPEEMDALLKPFPTSRSALKRAAEGFRARARRMRLFKDNRKLGHLEAEHADKIASDLERQAAEREMK